MRTLPSAWSIILTDNVCWAIATSAPMILFLALGIKLTGTMPGNRGKPDIPLDPDVASMVLASAVALILFLSAIVALRVARVRSLFDTGREVEASVRKVRHFRGSRQKLELEFELNGMSYKVSSVFLRWSRTPVFNEGTQIQVLVNPEKPKRAVPVALYEETGAAQRGEGPISAEHRSSVQKLALRLKHRSNASPAARGDRR